MCGTPARFARNFLRPRAANRVAVPRLHCYRPSYSAMATNSQGFTRIELLVTVLSLVLIGLVTLPALATTATHSQVAQCSNNLHRLGIALLAYADENSDFFPPRSAGPSWPERLRPYYKDIQILTCPADGPNPPSFGNPTNIADAAPRSYILNGWNDYFSTHNLSFTQAFPESAILEPSRTILFGEKDAQSPHFWFDYSAGDDYLEVENGRHLRSDNNPATGASNHAFADGSVQLLKSGTAFDPVILWFVVPEFRRLVF
jgi:hypothetical protein